MMQRQLTTIAFMLCSSFIIGEKIVHSADVDDGWRQALREGIEARRSAIHSLKLKYTVVTELTDVQAAALKRILEQSVKDGTKSRKEVDQMLKHPAPRTETTKVELLMSGGKIAASSTDAAPDGQSFRMVFDGEILTVFDGDSGKRARGTPEDALPETTIESLCRLQNMTLERLLELPRATSTLLPPAAENGDVVFRVRATSEPPKDSEVSKAQSEVMAEINTTKSFWPEHLVESFLPNDPDKPGVRYILREVRFSDFQKAGGIDIPRKIEETNSRLFNTTDDSGDIGVACGVDTRNTLIVDDIAINEPVDASEFVLNFPPGASYLDLDGDTKIVDPDGTIQNLSATLGKQYPVTEDKRNERAWGTGVWPWVGATTLLLAVAGALYSVRHLRAKGSAKCNAS